MTTERQVATATTDRPHNLRLFHRFTIFAWVALLGCGGMAVIDGPQGSGGAGGATTSSSSSTSTSTSTSTSSSTSSSGLEIILVESSAWAHCMPEVPPDPLEVDFTLWVDNSSGSQTVNAAVLGASLVGSAGTTSFLVTPPGTGSISPGTDGAFYFSKLPDSATGTSGCAWCGADGVMLYVDIEVGGTSYPVSALLDELGCDF